MKRRTFLIALLGAPAIVSLASCGDDRTTGGTTPDTTPDTTPGHTLPTGADDVLLRIRYDGGLPGPDGPLMRLPALLISGDGRVFTPAVIDAIYPGPLAWPVLVRSITADGMQQVISAADEAGLLGAVPDYSLPEGVGIYDAPNTNVSIGADGKVFEHSAYALGLEEQSQTSEARRNLDRFVNALSDLEGAVGAAELGADAPFTPTRWRIRAHVTDPAEWSAPEPTIVDWPAAAGVALAAASECAMVEAATIGDLIGTAKQNTLFRDAGVVYQLSALAVLPGDVDC
jgi:hypothetical protein